MSNKKIIAINGYMVNGKFQIENPNVSETVKYEFSGVVYDTLKEAYEAKHTLKNTLSVAQLMRNLTNNSCYVEPGVVASRILTTPNGIALYNVLKEYFEPEETNET